MVTYKTEAIINSANILSFARMILAPVFAIAILRDRYAIGIIILTIAILTDFIDGRVAKIWKMQTRLGKMLDPLADKVIIIFALLVFMIKFEFPIWIGLLVISRDLILLTGGILFLYRNRQKTLIPNLLGKITTFMQMSTILAYILPIHDAIKQAMLWLTVLVTLVSAAAYFIKGYYLFVRQPSLLNLPNTITLARILFIPIFIAFLMSDIPYKEIIVAFIFIILALSDALDGYLARKNKQVTNFGKLVDPLADKLLISAALIFLIGKGIQPWMAFVIIAREFAVTFLRTIAMARNITLPARSSGKFKTITQVVAITAVLLHFPFASELMIIAVIITVYSGVEYFWQGRNFFKEVI